MKFQFHSKTEESLCYISTYFLYINIFHLKIFHSIILQKDFSNYLVNFCTSRFGIGSLTGKKESHYQEIWKWAPFATKLNELNLRLKIFFRKYMLKGQFWQPISLTLSHILFIIIEQIDKWITYLYIYNISNLKFASKVKFQDTWSQWKGCTVFLIYFGQISQNSSKK